MVSVLDFRVRGLVHPSWRQFVVFLGKTLYSHSASLHPGVLWVMVNLMLVDNPAMD